eukprot:516703-Pelagomonas_calceolata.AAC.2
METRAHTLAVCLYNCFEQLQLQAVLFLAQWAKQHDFPNAYGWSRTLRTIVRQTLPLMQPSQHQTPRPRNNESCKTQHGHSPSSCASDLITASEQQGPKGSRFLDPAAANRLKAALQALADSELQDVQKKVVLEVALASVSVVEACSTGNVGHDQQAAGRWHITVMLLACAVSVAASLASLICSLWIIFILMEASIIPV